MKAEPWDRDLSKHEIDRLAPAHKGLRSRTALERKVQCLESWCKDPLLVRINLGQIPWKRPALRKWHDSARGLWSWGFTPVDLPDGDNSDLMDRYTDALSILKRMIDGTDPETEALKLRVAALEKQNMALIDQVLQLQRLIPKRGARK